MKYSQLTERTKVIDRWWESWGVGTVVHKLKTVVYIQYPSLGIVKYDRAHLKFLDKVGGQHGK